ncbi:MAG TPA: type II secretion system protein [Candidatus Saccharimonadales bacterium]
MSERGFTLIELVLYTGIIGSLLLVSGLFLQITQEAQIKNQSITEVEQQGIVALDYMTRTIRSAASVTTPQPGTTAGSLVLAGVSPTTFSVAAGVLQTNENGGTFNLTNNKVTMQNVQFTNLARGGTRDIIRISFTLARTNPYNNNLYEYSKTYIASAEVRL